MVSSAMQKETIIPDEIKNIILHSTEDGVKKKDVVKAVIALTGWGKTKSYEVYNKVLGVQAINKDFIEKLDGASQATSEFTRKTLREESFLRKILPPTTPDDLIDHATAMKLQAQTDKAASAIIVEEVKNNEPVKQSDLGIKHMSGKPLGAAKDEIVYDEVQDLDMIPDEGERKDVEDCGTHTFNHATKQFIWQLKDKTNVVIGSDMWKAMLREYKAGNTVEQIAVKHYLLPAYIQEIFKKEGITHNTFPATSQDLKNKDVSTMTEEERKFAFAQELEKESWKATQADANKWREFEYGTLEPYQNFLSNWKPKVYPTPVVPAPKSVNNDVFVIGLSDLHFGSFTSEATTFSGKSYSTKKAVDAVALYLAKIKQKLGEYKNPPNKAVILLMGDILHTHTNNGMTTKGTQLKYDVTGPEQLETAFNSLYTFINNIIGMFSEVHVHSVRGNHSGNGDWALSLALKSVFTVCSTVAFHNHKADHALVEIGKNTLAILTHGASDEVKAILPASEAARQTWAMNLFAQYDGNLSKKKQKLLLSADQHHIEVCEYSSFTHYMFPTAVSGDHYAESKGLNNRAAQLCLIVGDEGVTNHIPIYL
jgi:hypothetical protein